MLDDSGTYAYNSSSYSQCTQFDYNSGDEMSIVKDEYQFDQHKNDSVSYKSHKKNSSIDQNNTYSATSTELNSITCSSSSSIKHQPMRISSPVVLNTKLSTSPSIPSTSQLLPPMVAPQIQEQQQPQQAMPSTPLQPQTSQTSRQSSYIVSTIAIQMKLVVDYY